jgi:hypothetical protein
MRRLLVVFLAAAAVLPSAAQAVSARRTKVTVTAKAGKRTASRRLMIPG